MLKTLAFSCCLVKFSGLEGNFLMQAVNVDVLIAPLKAINLLF